MSMGTQVNFGKAFFMWLKAIQDRAGPIVVSVLICLGVVHSKPVYSFVHSLFLKQDWLFYACIFLLVVFTLPKYWSLLNRKIHSFMKVYMDAWLERTLRKSISQLSDEVVLLLHSIDDKGLYIPLSYLPAKELLKLSFDEISDDDGDDRQGYGVKVVAKSPQFATYARTEASIRCNARTQSEFVDSHYPELSEILRINRQIRNPSLRDTDGEFAAPS